MLADSEVDNWVQSKPNGSLALRTARVGSHEWGFDSGAGGKDTVRYSFQSMVSAGTAIEQSCVTTRWGHEYHCVRAAEEAEAAVVVSHVLLYRLTTALRRDCGDLVESVDILVW